VLIYNILSIFSSVSVHHSSKNRGPKPRELPIIPGVKNQELKLTKQNLEKISQPQIKQIKQKQNNNK
jgi:hypothetical protein